MEKTNPYWYFLYKDRCQKYWYMNDLSVGNITAGLKHNKKQGSLSPSSYFLLWFSVVRDFFFPFFFQWPFVILFGMRLLKYFLFEVFIRKSIAPCLQKAFKSCFKDSKKIIWAMTINFFSSPYSDILNLVFTKSGCWILTEHKNVPNHCFKTCMTLYA